MDLPMATIGWLVLLFLFLLLLVCLCAASLQKRTYFLSEDISRVEAGSESGGGGAGAGPAADLPDGYRRFVFIHPTSVSSARRGGERLVPFQMSAMQACLWSFERQERIQRLQRQEQKERKRLEKEDKPPTYEDLFGGASRVTEAPSDAKQVESEATGSKI